MNKTLGAAKLRLAPARGFTLIEMLIVVAVMGILAAIAYPSYTEHVRETRRTDATTELMEAAHRLERCYTQFNNVYNDVNCPIQLGTAFDSSEGFYTITPAFVTAARYTLTATPVVGSLQAGDTECTSFTLRNTGARTATGPLGDDCWD